MSAVPSSGFHLPAALARAVWAHCGVPAPESVGQLDAAVEAVSRLVPAGTTAKLDAVERGEVPPGADPVPCAEAILAGARTSWSCWPLTTLVAALLGSCGWDAAVVATRRIDVRAPAVDFHAAVVVGSGSPGGRLLVDPYHYVPPLPLGGGVAESTRPGRWACLDSGPGRWVLTEGGPRFGILRYRVLTDPLDAGDVAALCRVSVVFSGAAPRRQATWLRLDGYAILRTTAAGALRLDRWRAARPGAVWDGTWERTACSSWDEGWERATGEP